MSLLFVQHIQTYWSKSSRGGEGARLRAAAADRVPLPGVEGDPAPDCRVVLQDVSNNERGGFCPAVQQQVFLQPMGSQMTLGLTEVLFGSDHVDVAYHYQHSLGAPSRVAIVRPTFTLRSGQWGLITANGRQTHEWGYTYTRHVFHFGLIDLAKLPGGLSEPPEVPSFVYRDEHSLR